MNIGVLDPARLDHATLPDGRRLALAEWGPEDGAPVLLCPGAATSRWLGFGGHVVDTLGVRLISIDRPGLGSSDPLPGRTLLDWADDIRSLIAARSLSQPAIVGCSQGAPFALTCAAAGIASAVAIVSGTDELGEPDLRGRAHPRRAVDGGHRGRRSGGSRGLLRGVR
ncbi:MAG: alpha/beta fold hydrolase [Minicystis sp.]